MGLRQKLFNDYISPAVGSCGMVIKMEPSIVYPTSHVNSQESCFTKKKLISAFLFSHFVFQVDLNVRVNVDDVDHLHDKIHIFNNKKINVRGTLDAKAASTSESVCTWDVNMNIDMSQGHTANNVKIQMTRETPGEKKLKVAN